MLKKIHLGIGITGLVIFIATGQYFKLYLHGLQDLDNSYRLLLRSAHVYLFFASFINLLFGLYYPEPPGIKWTTIINQGLVMLSPILLFYSFVFEVVGNTGIDRKAGALGVVLIFIWLVNSLTGRAWTIIFPKELFSKNNVDKKSS
jgi:hypothetical protein